MHAHDSQIDSGPFRNAKVQWGIGKTSISTKFFYSTRMKRIKRKRKKSCTHNYQIKAVTSYLLYFFKQCGYSSLNKWTMITARPFLRCSCCSGITRQSLRLRHWHSRLILFRKLTPFYSTLIVNVKVYRAEIFSLYLQIKGIHILPVKGKFGSAYILKWNVKLFKVSTFLKYRCTFTE